jgi:hypothetical protein
MQTTAARVQQVFLALVVLGVFVQVYLIAAYIFGAGSSALDAHKTIGNIVLAAEILAGVAGVVGWRGSPLMGMSIGLPLIGVVQIALASATRWVGGLHGLFALLVTGLAISLLIRTRRELGPSSLV